MVDFPSNPLTPVSYANQIIDLLGLNNWNLQAGSYNGVKFHVVTEGILARLNEFNPAAGIISDIQGFASSFGASEDLNAQQSNSALPYGTKTVATSVMDSGRRKLIEHKIPNANFNTLEDKGFGGDTITCIGVMFGPSSYAACQNFFRAALNDLSVAVKDRNVLVHPVFGTLKKVFLSDYERVHSSEKFRAVTYKLVFKLSEPIFIDSPPANFTASLFQTIKSCLNIYSKIVSSISTFGLAAKALKLQLPNAPSVLKKEIVFYQSNSKKTSTVLSADFNYLVNSFYEDAQIGIGLLKNIYYFLSETKSSNAFLDSVEIDPTLLENYSSAFSDGYSNGVIQTITEYSEKLNSDFSFMRQKNLEVYFSEIMNSLKSLLKEITDASRLLLDKIEGSSFVYKTPRDMTLEEVLFENSIDVFDYEKQKRILLLNFKSNQSCNYIQKGVSLTIPKD